MNQPTRGERNNNPGNIDRTNIVWQGMASVQSDPRFIMFTTPQYGIRALAKVLINYQQRDGLKTVQQIIDRWAPPVENNSTAYVNAVADALNVQPEDGIDLADAATLTAIVKAIIQHENGRVSYTQEAIDDGVNMALA